MSTQDQYKELVSWQRMHELNIEISKATEHAVGRDCAFRDEILDAAGSAERNIAEGFGRHNSMVFANFLDFSSAAARQTRSPRDRPARRGRNETSETQRSPGTETRR